MLTLHGVTLSLLLSWGPTNGFDPTLLADLEALSSTRGEFSLKNPEKFVEWLNASPVEHSTVVAYYVGCAFSEDSRVTAGGRTWPGYLGLAPGMESRFGAGKATSLSDDEGKWVSACLMAYANMEGSHQYIQIRGNPPGAAGTRLVPTAGERWTMGYPEGVFFGDLLNFNVVEQKDPGAGLAKPRQVDRVFVRKSAERTWLKADLERSFTLSLNLPKDYSRLDSDKWAPPNAYTGRTLDFDGVTEAEHRRPPPAAADKVRVAERLGPYHSVRWLFEAAEQAADPDYATDSVCVAKRKVVPCQVPGAERLRPLFVHGPRVVHLASAGSTVDPGATMQAVFSGAPALGAGQLKDCALDKRSCTGAFALTSVGEPPVPPARRASRSLEGLKPGQSVTAVLGFDSEKEGYQLDLEEPFTAIVRYRGVFGARGRVEATRPDGTWRTFTEEWPATAGSWEWLQVFPVYAFKDPARGGRPAIMVKVSGVGGGKPSPILDVAGFVSGPPWCFDTGVPAKEKEFKGVCAPAAAGMLPAAAPASMLRRAPASFKASNLQAAQAPAK